MPSSPSWAEHPHGLIVSAHGRHVVVEDRAGARVLCHVRGKRSVAVVGDRVRWQRSGDEGVIEEIVPRANLLYRQDEWKTKAFAANIDQLLVVVAAEPTFSESQPARVVLNKRDLPAFAAARKRLAPYAAMGTEIVEVALKPERDDARARLAP